MIFTSMNQFSSTKATIKASIKIRLRSISLTSTVKIIANQERFRWLFTIPIICLMSALITRNALLRLVSFNLFNWWSHRKLSQPIIIFGISTLQRTKLNLLRSLIIEILNFRRQCYFEDERSLKFFTSYSQKKCLEECHSNITLSRCGCVEFFIASKEKH